MNRNFDPWVGSRYEAGGSHGIRILILGEAHYGEADDAHQEFTQDIVRTYGQESRFAFFTRVQSLIENREGYIPDIERGAFWEGVAFYNFVQEFPGSTPRIRPTAKMWQDAIAPYFATISELDPELIIILGDELWEHVPYDEKKTPLCGISHPSSYGFDTDKWKAEIANAIQQIKINKEA